MESVFFNLPPELQQLTLQFLPLWDLDRLFDLQALSQPNVPDPYLIVRHQALAAKYMWKSIVVSNDPDLATISLDQLDYLMLHRIYISPKDVTLAVFDFTNYASSVAFMHKLFTTYLPVLQNYTRNFRIRLILVENVPLDNSFLRLLFEPLCSPQLNLSWFTIKYLPGFSKLQRNHDSETSLMNLLTSTNEIAIENLELHLFDASNLVQHLVDSNGCFHCENLRTLDLSFNNLTEWNLRNLKFPSTLEHLNLSNNQLRGLTNSSFHHQSLTNLKTLDLSNNNLMRIELHNYRNGPNGPYVLESVNLSGNILSDYSGMFHSDLFLNLKAIDLSLNLIQKVSKFPSSLVSIDLSGNYLSLSFDSVNTIFPAGLRKLSLGTNGSLATCGANSAKMMIQAAGLQNLQELELCGSMYDTRYALY